MNRISIAAAAAATLLASGSAQAKVPLVNLGDICHSLAVVVDHSRVSGFSLAGCQTGNFVGVIGKVRGSEGRALIASLQMPSEPETQFLLQISYPLVNGGTWSLYYTKDGYNAKLYQAGTYTVIK